MPNISTDLSEGAVTFTGIVTAPAGVVGNVTGNTAGTHTGDVTGNLTGNVTGNVTGNTTGTHTGNVASATTVSGFTVSAVTTLALAGTVTAAATTVAVTGNLANDYGSLGATLITVMTSDASGYTINSLGIASGRIILFVNGNTAARTFVFVHEGTGTAIFKLACPTAANYTLQPGMAVILFYDAALSRIRVIPLT